MKTYFFQNFQIILLKLHIRLPFLLLLSFYAIFYLNFIKMHIIPNFLKEEYLQIDTLRNLESQAKSVLIWFHLFFLMSLWSMAKVILTPPGTPLESWHFGVKEQIIESFIKNSKQEQIITQSGGNFYHLLFKDLFQETNFQGKQFKAFLEAHNVRFCKFCERFKPPRAHHCRQCSMCVLKMDHHCNWLLNCIGFKNYRFFL